MNRNSRPHKHPSARTSSDHNDSVSSNGRSQSLNSGLSSLLKQTGLAIKLVQKSGIVLLGGREAMGPIGFAHVLMGIWVMLAVAATVFELGITELLERQTQTLFFQLRGTTKPPEDIVILAIDEPSLEQDQFFYNDPETFSHLEPLSRWPWQRKAYAIAIERLIDAGARSVAIDLIFASPSSWNAGDDDELLRAIEENRGRVTLAASYENQELPGGQGTITQLIEPISMYRTNAAHIGFINYWYDLDGKIYEFSHSFLEKLAVLYPDQQPYFETMSQTVPSFDEAVLRASEINYFSPSGQGIYFFGPAGTFQTQSFWTVIEPKTWKEHLREDEFKDKVVLIGPTATLFHDFHGTPFGKVSGVEVHANAIATLMTQRAVTEALQNRFLQGIFIAFITIGSSLVISRPQHLTQRTARTIGFLVFWSLLSFGVFVTWRVIFPTAIPLGAIALSGMSYVTAGLVREKLYRLKLRQTLKQYASSPIIREILSQQDDLQDLLQERDQDIVGRMLAGRYQLAKTLGSGGFGQTYIAADLQRPGQPFCVVKQLQPATDDPKLFRLSRRYFQQEAEILERLGKHNQIPQLLAYFEENQEFYLVQEFIDGHPLRQELLPGQILTEPKIVELITEILLVVDFIHRCGVIHRDIKPSNIIRRRSDQKLVLIDFGAVKAIQQKLTHDQTQLQTIGIGTRGYMPSEQSAGTPKFNSDLYAIGVIGIQALTGLPPERIQQDEKTGELVWKNKAPVSFEMAEVLSKITRYSFKERYQSVQEVLKDLDVLLRRYDLLHILSVQQSSSISTIGETHHLIDPISSEDLESDEDLSHAGDITLRWLTSMTGDPETLDNEA